MWIHISTFHVRIVSTLQCLDYLLSHEFTSEEETFFADRMQPQTQAEIQTQTDVAVLSPSSSSSALVATNSNVNNEKNDKNNNTSDSRPSTSPPAATDVSTSSHGPAAQTPPQRKIKRVLIELRTLFATMQARYCRRTLLAKRMRKRISVPKPRYHVCISFFLIRYSRRRGTCGRVRRSR